MEKMENKRIFSVMEAAQYLGISKSLAYRLVNEGEIPAIKLGKRLLIPATAIDKLIEIKNE